MEIQPASIQQIQRTKDGRLVEIEDDVGGIAMQIREISPDLHLRFSEAGGYFVVYQEIQEGERTKQQLVTTAQELDGRLLQRIREITAEGYDLGAEIDKRDAERRRDFEREQDEKIEDLGQRLHHAMLQDRGLTGHRAFIKGK